MKSKHTFKAKCLDCDWENNTRNAHPSAKHHAETRNHRVDVQWNFHYNQ